MNGRAILKFVWNLNNPDYNFVWVTVLVEQIEFYHGVIAPDITLDIYYFVVLQVLLDFLLKNKKSIGEINFNRTGVVGGGLHVNSKFKN